MKITVLPVTENCPLPPLHHRSRTVSPLADIEIGDPLRPGLGRHLQRHFHAEGKTIVSARRG